MPQLKSPRNPRSKAALIVGCALVLLLAGSAIGWAATNVLAQKPLVENREYSTVVVEPGTVESSFAVNVRATWPRTLVPTGALTGTLTTLPEGPTEALSAGDRLLTIDLNPVYVLQGEVPMFRELSEGSSGADVAQLQSFLESQEYLTDYSAGTWEYSTTQAVIAWQRATERVTDGTVHPHEVVFVESLPARFAFDTETVKAGTRLAGGEAFVYRLASAPLFDVPLSDAQAATTPVGSEVSITSPGGGEWPAWIVDIKSETEDGGTTFVLNGNEDGSTQVNLCDSECSEIPVEAEGVLLRSRVIAIPERKGLVVPSAALTTNAQGEATVITEEGQEITVTVVAGARGMTVIEGVEQGTRLRAPAGSMDDTP